MADIPDSAGPPGARRRPGHPQRCGEGPAEPFCRSAGVTEPDDTKLKSEIEAICARIDTIMQSIEIHFQDHPPPFEIQDQGYRPD